MSSELVEAIFRASGAEEFKAAFKGAETAVKEFENVGKEISSAGKSMSKWVTGPVVAAGTGLFALANSAANTGDELFDLAAKTGTSIEGFQELMYWSDQNGISQSSLERATGRLNQRMGLAANGNEKYSTALETLGVSMESVENGTISTEEAFATAISTLSQMENEQQKSALASELFGTKLSRELMPALQDSAMGIEEAGQVAREMGIIMDEEAVIAADNFAQEISDLKQMFGALFRDLGTDLIPLFSDVLFPLIQETLLPAFRNFIDYVSQLITWFANLSPEMQRNIILIIAIAAAIGPLLVMIGTLIEAVSSVAGALFKLGGVFAKIGAPALAWIAVIGLVVAAVIHLWNTNEEFRQNIQVIWGNIQTIIVAVWEAIQPGAMAFIAILMGLIGVIAEVIVWVSQVVAMFSDWIVSFIETHSWIMELIAVLGVIVGVIAGVIAVVAVVVKIFTAVVAIVKVVAAIFMFFTSPIGLVIAAIAALIAIIVWLGDKFEWIGNIVDGVSNWVSNAWGGFLDLLGIGTKEAADEAGDSIEGLSDTTETETGKMAETGSSNVSELQESVTSDFVLMNKKGSRELKDLNKTGASELDDLNKDGSSSIDGLSSDVLASMGDMSDGSINEASVMNNDISGCFADLENSGNIDMGNLNIGVSDEMSSMSSTGISEISDLYATGSSDFSNLESDIMNSTRGMESAVDNGFSGMSKTVDSEMSNIGNSADSGMGELSDAVQSNMQDSVKVTASGMLAIYRAVQDYIQQSVTVTASGMQAVNGAFDSGMAQNLRVVTRTGNQIVTQFRGLHSQLRNTGIHAMNGLRSGLNLGSRSVMSTARNIANQVSRTINNALKVRSPSRVTMETGEDVGEGFEIGLRNMVKEIIKASKGLALAAIPDISPADVMSGFKNVHSQFKRGTEYNPSNKSDVPQQPIIVQVEGDSEWIKAYVNEGNRRDMGIGGYVRGY